MLENGGRGKLVLRGSTRTFAATVPSIMTRRKRVAEMSHGDEPVEVRMLYQDTNQHEAKLGKSDALSCSRKLPIGHVRQSRLTMYTVSVKRDESNVSLRL